MKFYIVKGYSNNNPIVPVNFINEQDALDYCHEKLTGWSIIPNTLFENKLDPKNIEIQKRIDNIREKQKDIIIYINKLESEYETLDNEYMRLDKELESLK